MRLFLALVPPTEVRCRLGGLADRLHRELGGRRIPDTNFHLTLAFLGEQPPETASHLLAWLGTKRLSPDAWTLDRVGHFRGPGIIWAGARRPPDTLMAVQARLSEELRAQGIELRPRRFLPHVSLLRNTMPNAAQLFTEQAFRWPYTQIHLIQSVASPQGSCYRSLGSTQDVALP